jgi:hypothetical protein
MQDFYPKHLFQMLEEETYSCAWQLLSAAAIFSPSGHSCSHAGYALHSPPGNAEASKPRCTVAQHFIIHSRLIATQARYYISWQRQGGTSNKWGGSEFDHACCACCSATETGSSTLRASPVSAKCVLYLPFTSADLHAPALRHNIMIPLKILLDTLNSILSDAIDSNLS